MAQRVLRHVLTAGSKASKVLRNQVAAAARHELEPVAVRATNSQPIHPQALRRQLKSSSARWYSTAHSSVRRFFSTSGSANAPRYADRVAFLKSSVASNAVWKAPGRAPFASTLRPNLTGGALPRTAGGYSGASRSGARYFSHTPAAPAQVVQNVSQAMRAFWLSGQRARFDGTDAQGRPAYRAISALEDETARKLQVPAMPRLTPGAYVDFPLNPTITALAPVVVSGAGAPFKAAAAAFAAPATLGTEGFLDVLNVDFSRALKELSAIMNDLRRLAALGDLPIVLESSARGSSLRVRFPGVDALTVDHLCEDLGITRGIVGQDPGFDAAVGTHTALKFPFAPESSDEDALTSPGGSLRSHQSSTFSVSVEDELLSEDDEIYDAFFEENPWLSVAPSSSGEAPLDIDLSSSDGYESMSPPVPVSSGANSREFEGLEGVYRFIAECDRARF